jgi:hypothetical protein
MTDFSDRVAALATSAFVPGAARADQLLDEGDMGRGDLAPDPERDRAPAG